MEVFGTSELNYLEGCSKTFGNIVYVVRLVDLDTFTHFHPNLRKIGCFVE